MRILAIFLFVLIASDCRAQSGYQTINGTRVFTQIDQAARVATFSNDCGSQKLTQKELQEGAIPDQIIPCPRPHSERNTAEDRASTASCQSKNPYDPSQGQNKAFMAAACMYYCLYGQSQDASMLELYERSQRLANNMCSMSRGDCNNIDKQLCQ